MTPKINFNPGPSQLYFTVEDHVRQAFREGIPSLSHRSREFEKIYAEVKEGLRALLTIPENYHIVFTGSATEIWERIIQNLVEHNSHHFVNGAFSNRFFEMAQQLGKHPTQTVAADGYGFNSFSDIPSTELFAITQNETSTGVSLSNQCIDLLRNKNNHALIVVDAVSSLPYPDIDYSKVDSVFFSVQKGFGLPAGLGVWLVNDRCIAKAESLHSKGTSIGSYHSLPTLISHAKKNQTPETPNVLGIYLLNRVVQDMLRRGITIIRKETEYKAAIVYHALEQHPTLKPFVTENEFRSKTVMVAACSDKTTQLTNYLLQKGILPGAGYGSFKDQHLRFANFPAHSKEQVELLVDLIGEFNM